MIVAGAYELQSIYETALRRERKLYGAAPTTVKAVMYSLRERSEVALAELDCQRRLADLSTEQLREVIARLMNLRPRYPAITDDLIFELSELL